MRQTETSPWRPNVGLMEYISTIGRTRLLSVNMCADDQHGYFVSFQQHRNDIAQVEYVWIVLHYLARILYVLDPRDRLPHLLLQRSIAVAIETRLDLGSDVFKETQFDDVARLLPQSPEYPAWRSRSTLYFVAAVRRQLWVQFSCHNTKQQLVYSVLALLQASLGQLDNEGCEVLRRSLGAMLVAYIEGEDYGSVNSLHNLPNEAIQQVVLASCG
jgi:hypothetical protein